MDLKFYTIKELTDILKVSEITLLRIIERGEIRAFKVGREWRIEHQDLLTYINEKANK